MRRRRSSNRSGQALVEFALTVPILLLLVVSIIEFGRLMSAYQTITDTAREAARRAVLADRPCEEKRDEIIEDISERLRIARLDPAALQDTVPIVDCDAQTASGDPSARVTLIYDHRMPWLERFIGREAVSLTAETHMRQE